MAATILICTPIFLPICMQYGMDPVQFGMVMLINCALGLNTPPVGHDAVRRLRDRRASRSAGDEDDRAVLRRADRGADDRHLRAGVLAVAAAARRLPARESRHGGAELRHARRACRPRSRDPPTTRRRSASASSTWASARSIARTRRSTPTTVLARDPRWGICGVSLKTPRATRAAGGAGRPLHACSSKVAEGTHRARHRQRCARCCSPAPTARR